MDINLDAIPIQQILINKNIAIDVLRLDAIHETISGNKYFKLIKNIELAKQNGYSKIVTLGGAFSNHLHATAFICKQLGLQSIGVIRGAPTSNPTIKDCENWGMSFCFTDYLHWVNINYKQLLANIEVQYPDAYFIPMGGDNMAGVEGIALLQNYFFHYDCIICSVGTGTTLAGIRKYTLPHQTVIGVQAVQDNSVAKNIAYKSGNENFVLINNCTFGGFAKYDAQLIAFMQWCYNAYQLPLDFVYTAKTMYALCSGQLNEYVDENKKILLLHTGGLQGNRGVAEIENIYR
jgi:1-aminocyclopropane-1-carboxylate deaminase